MKDRQLGLILGGLGLVVVILDIIYALYLKGKYPVRFHLLGFHPVIDSLAIIGVFLGLLGGYLWLVRKPKY